MHSHFIKILRRFLPALFIAALATALAAVHVDAKIFHARNEIFALVFPGADRIEPTDFLLTHEQHARIESLSRARLESDLVTVYTVYRDADLLGYAVLDTHVVRTLPETLFTVLNPDGSIQQTHILAFHEPLDYMPTKRWLALLTDRNRRDELRLGRDIAGITGSTLSTRAILASVRRALAIYEVLL